MLFAIHIPRLGFTTAASIQALGHSGSSETDHSAHGCAIGNQIDATSPLGVVAERPTIPARSSYEREQGELVDLDKLSISESTRNVETYRELREMSVARLIGRMS